MEPANARALLNASLKIFKLRLSRSVHTISDYFLCTSRLLRAQEFEYQNNFSMSMQELKNLRDMGSIRLYVLAIVRESSTIVFFFDFS